MPIPTAPKYEMSIKDALVFAELLPKEKAGRGKPSSEMQTQADMLVRDYGYRIKGRVVSGVKSSTPTAEPAKVERVKTTTGKDISELIPQTRGDDLIPIMPDGKTWPMGIRGLCNACGVSLTHCPCITPRVWLDFQTEGAVTFKVKRG